jgi:glucose dehydrogenase
VCVLVSALLAASGSALAQTAPDVPVFPLRVRWSIDLAGTPSAGPASDGTHVYVGLADGRVVAVHATSGQVTWEATEAPTRYSPVVDGGRVHLVEPDEVTTLDAATGAELWRVPLSSPASAPSVARGGWIVIATDDAEVLALRADDGTVVWHRRYPNAVVARAAINGDRLYLPGADSQVRAVNLVTGQPLWERRIGGAVLSVSPLADRIYVGAKDNFFYCLDEASGRILWRWRTGGDMVGPAQVDERRVFFSNLDTLLRALDRRNGAQRWRRPLPWRPQTGPILMGSTAIVSGLALDLRGFATDTGLPVGEFTLSPDRLEVLVGVPQRIARTVLPGDFLVMALADGRVVAVEHAFGLQATPLTTLPGEPMALTPPPPPG